MDDLLQPGVLFALGVTLAFPILVIIAVAVLRRVVARRNPELAPSRIDQDPGAA